MSLRLVSLLLIAACGGHLWNPPDPAPVVLPLPPENAHQIRSIQLARHGCLGPCPVYIMELKADGSASYEGRFSVQFLGHYAAELDSTTFLGLGVRLLKDGLFRLRDHNPFAIDAPSLTITVSYTRDTLITRAIAGSEYLIPQLHRAASRIDSVMAVLHWVHVGEAAH